LFLLCRVDAFHAPIAFDVQNANQIVREFFIADDIADRREATNGDV
jgi:hypothetical protein